MRRSGRRRVEVRFGCVRDDAHECVGGDGAVAGGANEQWIHIEFDDAIGVRLGKAGHGGAGGDRRLEISCRATVPRDPASSSQ